LKDWTGDTKASHCCLYSKALNVSRSKLICMVNYRYWLSLAISWSELFNRQHTV